MLQPALGEPLRDEIGQGVLEHTIAGRAEIDYLSEHEPVHLHTVPGFDQCTVRFTTDIPYLSKWGGALLLGATLASTDPATLVPIFQQVHIRDRVAQTVVSESAFNDATGAITTFAVAAVTLGGGEFSLTASLLDLLKQLIVGIVAGAGLGIAAGLHLPHGVGWRELVVVGSTASIGLVFALFFATAVMPLGPLLLEMKMGALLTIGGGALAFAAARLLRVGRFAR